MIVSKKIIYVLVTDLVSGYSEGHVRRKHRFSKSCPDTHAYSADDGNTCYQTRNERDALKNGLQCPHLKDVQPRCEILNEFECRGADSCQYTNKRCESLKIKCSYLEKYGSNFCPDHRWSYSSSDECTSLFDCKKKCCQYNCHDNHEKCDWISPKKIRESCLTKNIRELCPGLCSNRCQRKDIIHAKYLTIQQVVLQKSQYIFMYQVQPQYQWCSIGITKTKGLQEGRPSLDGMTVLTAHMSKNLTIIHEVSGNPPQIKKEISQMSVHGKNLKVEAIMQEKNNYINQNHFIFKFDGSILLDALQNTTGYSFWQCGNTSEINFNNADIHDEIIPLTELRHLESNLEPISSSGDKKEQYQKLLAVSPFDKNSGHLPCKNKPTRLCSALDLNLLEHACKNLLIVKACPKICLSRCRGITPYQQTNTCTNKIMGCTKWITDGNPMLPGIEEECPREFKESCKKAKFLRKAFRVRHKPRKMEEDEIGCNTNWEKIRRHNSKILLNEACNSNPNWNKIKKWIGIPYKEDDIDEERKEPININENDNDEPTHIPLSRQTVNINAQNFEAKEQNERTFLICATIGGQRDIVRYILTDSYTEYGRKGPELKIPDTGLEHDHHTHASEMPGAADGEIMDAVKNLYVIKPRLDSYQIKHHYTFQHAPNASSDYFRQLGKVPQEHKHHLTFKQRLHYDQVIKMSNTDKYIIARQRRLQIRVESERLKNLKSLRKENYDSLKKIRAPTQGATLFHQNNVHMKVISDAIARRYDGPFGLVSTNIVDTFKKTALHYAQLSDDKDLIDLLDCSAISEYRCSSSKQCIPKWRNCDGSNDCADGSDEYGCIASAALDKLNNLIHYFDGPPEVLYHEEDSEDHTDKIKTVRRLSMKYHSSRSQTHHVSSSHLYDRPEFVNVQKINFTYTFTYGFALLCFSASLFGCYFTRYQTKINQNIPLTRRKSSYTMESGINFNDNNVCYIKGPKSLDTEEYILCDKTGNVRRRRSGKPYGMQFYPEEQLTETILNQVHDHNSHMTNIEKPRRVSISGLIPDGEKSNVPADPTRFAVLDNVVANDPDFFKKKKKNKGRK